MTARPSRFLSAFAIATYAFLFAPIVVLIIFSFNDSRRTFVWRGFTLGEMLLPCAILVAFGGVCFAVGVRGLRHG